MDDVQTTIHINQLRAKAYKSKIECELREQIAAEVKKAVDEIVFREAMKYIPRFTVVMSERQDVGKYEIHFHMEYQGGEDGII
jgi:hypothetical protein